MSLIIDTAKLTHFAMSAPAAKTSTVTGTGVDIQDYMGKITIIQDSGAGGGTSPTLNGKIQDSADNSTFADVTGATFTQVAGSASKQTLTLDTRSLNRYIRYVGTIAGTSPSFALAVNGIGQLNNA